MGLLQSACETYDCMKHKIGEYESSGDDTNKRILEPLAPISHALARAQIEIVLDAHGKFYSAKDLGKDAPKIIIPVTEESASRTSKPCAHPLCDRLDYIAPYDTQKHTLYLKLLEDWTQSAYAHPKLPLILQYVRSGTILQDLSRIEVIHLQENGKPKDEKLIVRWNVLNSDPNETGECWSDKKLMESFIQYYASVRQAMSSSVCMISGKTEPTTELHPKGIVAASGNAKLISSNDDKGFTYLGRFQNAQQAATISYTASQKAHNALRWLVANQGVIWGGRTFLCWNPQGNPLPKPTDSPMIRKKSNTLPDPTAYKDALKKSLMGWKQNLRTTDEAVIVAFDAATTGRLAVTYFNKLIASDFLERLYRWEETCCWENGIFGIQSPTLFQIINWAFGSPRNGKPDLDPKFLRQQMQRLMACRIDGSLFPTNIERALVEQASNLVIYLNEQKKNSKANPFWDLLFTACAVIRKYRFDHFKEDWNMMDETNIQRDKLEKNRSFLFGRLLAIAEIVERSAYGSNETREPNAMRFQKRFSLRPMSVWRTLEERLLPYYSKLSPGLRNHYRNLCAEIVEQLLECEEDLDRKLEDVYLLGYYTQRVRRSEKHDATDENIDSTDKS